VLAKVFACEFNQTGKELGVTHSNICEDLAIKGAVGLFETVDELAIGDVVVFGRSGDPSDPKFAEVAFILATVAEGIIERTSQGFHGLTIDASASRDKARDELEFAIAATSRLKTSFNPHLFPPSRRKGAVSAFMNPSVQLSVV